MLPTKPTLHDKTRKLALLACYFQARAIAQRARAEARQTGSSKRRKRPARPRLGKKDTGHPPVSNDFVASIRTLAER